MSKDRFPDTPIPDVIEDPGTKKTYLKGKFLGKGGFAKCFELTDKASGELLAGKIVPKCLLAKPQQKDKMKMEIDLHRRMNHENIVKFHGFFEDSNFVYIILELCKKRSLMELHKRRKAVTEPEARFFVTQILNAVSYIHKCKIIHRDLKLGNLFLSDSLNVKIGDFGLATRIEAPGDRRKTICGTPNYIAPEVLLKRGHSYEVDVWAIGCILFTLLVGKPPFETQTLKDTYNRIKANEYHIPAKVGGHAAALIRRLLCPEPSDRPSVDQVLNDDFIRRGYLPKQLPPSCISMTPRFDSGGGGRAHLSRPQTEQAAPPSAAATAARRPALSEVKSENQPPASHRHSVASLPGKPALPFPGTTGENRPKSSVVSAPSLSGSQRSVNGSEDEIKDASLVSPVKHLQQLRNMLAYIEKLPSNQLVARLSEEAESPDLVPVYWVSKWVDYSDKYGLSYQLCDGSVGVLYNDNSRMILFDDEQSIQFIDQKSKESFHTLTEYPPDLKKKITLLKYFRSYMNEHLLKTGGDVERRGEEELQARLPYLRTWFRTKNAIILSLSNGTVQINFFQCHSKLVLCPVMRAVSYIDEDKQFRTFAADSFATHGCTKHLQSRLRYALSMIEKLASSFSSSGAGSRPQSAAALHK